MGFLFSLRIRRSSKPAKFERKVLIFGDVASEDDDVGASHFLGIVRRVLREALDGLLSASEVSLRERVLIFVDVTSEEEDVGASHFLGIVRRVLREALDGLLSASEVSLRERF